MNYVCRKRESYQQRRTTDKTIHFLKAAESTGGIAIMIRSDAMKLLVGVLNGSQFKLE